LLAPLGARQPQFTIERPIKTMGAGPHRLEVDAALLSGGQPFLVMHRGDRAVAERGLADLRLFDASGGVVQHLLVPPRPAEIAWVAARTTLPLPPTKTTSGFEADLGEAIDVDALRVDGLRAPFLKRLTLEGSGDRQRWTVLAADATLFDLPQERLRQTTLSFPASRLRYLRVTWNDANSGRVDLPGGAAARPAARAPAPAAATSPVDFERRPSEPGRSRYLIRLPGARLPVVALELGIAGGHVFRPAVVTESRLAGNEAAPFELGRATLTRVVRDDIAAASLRVPMRQPTEAELQLVIEDGSNPPLELTAVSMVFAELPVIYFEAPEGAVVARYGDRTLQAPAYDLEAARPTIDLASARDATWGEPVRVTPAPAAGDPGPLAPSPGAELDPATFRHARAISGAPGLSALTLDAAVLAHSRGPSARFADVRILDDVNRQIPYLLERRDEPQAVQLPLAPRDASSLPDLGSARGRQSVYAITLPYPNLPPPKLVLETSERVFQRQIRIGVEREPDRRHRDRWFQPIGAATWRHADRMSAAPALSIDLQPVDAVTVLIAVDEGDNAALPITSAQVLLPTYRVRFYRPESSLLRLVYGRDDLEAPQYDLALLGPQVMGAPAAVATAAADAGAAGGAAPDRSSVISPLTFWILLGGAVLVLLALIVRLIRTPDRT
jgi:hypothetical protein